MAERHGHDDYVGEPARGRKPLRVRRRRASLSADVVQANATESHAGFSTVFSTDPPYFDNIAYADLADFFYIWLRCSLREIYPSLFSTMLTPKAEELIASPFLHGGKGQAETFFLEGMTRALRAMAYSSAPQVPVTIYYAFKQSETESEGTSSTGWGTFLRAILDSGFSLTGTWPIRTERTGRTRDIGSNALATSIVLVCRTRPPDATVITRSEFLRALRSELPAALKALQHGNIAPVDVAQASIGPGMAIFSRHAKVLEADGSTMTVRSALQLINEALDEHLSAQEGDLDSDTRFAITWYEEHGWAPGPYGSAETLAKARNISVGGVVEAGIAHSAAGKVRLLKRTELPADWDPVDDQRLTIWEGTQHLIKSLEEQGEQAAARLLRRLGRSAEQARELAYRLYMSCERRKRAEDAGAYNGLVIAWPELEKLASSMTPDEPQLGLNLGDAPAASVPAARAKGKKARR